jgi:hypothetical protein
MTIPFESKDTIASIDIKISIIAQIVDVLEKIGEHYDLSDAELFCHIASAMHKLGYKCALKQSGDPA